MLTAAQNGGRGPGGPRASMAKYREVIAKLRPGNALPDAPGECWVLARAHEGLAFEYAGAGETAKAIESLYSVAVLTLLFDDPRMRGRALATVADLRESAAETASAAAESATVTATAAAAEARTGPRPETSGAASRGSRTEAPPGPLRGSRAETGATPAGSRAETGTSPAGGAETSSRTGGWATESGVRRSAEPF